MFPEITERLRNLLGLRWSSDSIWDSPVVYYLFLLYDMFVTIAVYTAIAACANLLSEHVLTPIIFIKHTKYLPLYRDVVWIGCFMLGGAVLNAIKTLDKLAKKV